jgi:Fur family ferric uptake transcriptional regulator
MIRNRKQINTIQGHPMTNQRKLVLDLLREKEGHIDAKELFRLATVKDGSISQATVYRCLKLFKELGLIDEMRIDGLRCYYELKQSEEHQHLICQGCGKIIEFNYPEFHKLVEMIQKEHCFNVTKIELYLHGYCTECGKKPGSDVQRNKQKFPLSDAARAGGDERTRHRSDT